MAAEPGDDAPQAAIGGARAWKVDKKKLSKQINGDAPWEKKEVKL